jgi:hypothetical protein
MAGSECGCRSRRTRRSLLSNFDKRSPVCRAWWGSSFSIRVVLLQSLSGTSHIQKFAYRGEPNTQHLSRLDDSLETSHGQAWCTTPRRDVLGQRSNYLARVTDNERNVTSRASLVTGVVLVGGNRSRPQFGFFLWRCYSSSHWPSFASVRHLNVRVSHDVGKPIGVSIVATLGGDEHE